jgi:antitoxin MazE
MDDSKVILRALGEIRRLAIVQAASQPQRRFLFPRPHVYAIIHRIYPILDESHGVLTEREDILFALPFTESYDVGYDFVKEIYDKLDAAWIGREELTFYQLENPYRFGDKNMGIANLRKDLVAVCRYLYLHSSFDNDFWNGFMSNAPQESTVITEPWSDEELLFVI